MTQENLNHEMYEINNSNVLSKDEQIGGMGLQPQLSFSGMKMNRYFSDGGKNPFEFDIYGNPIKWISEEVNVTDDVGKIIFTQSDVSRPDFWTSLAIKVVASKYFWGDQGKGERENSIKKLVGRVSRYFGRQSLEQKYFDETGANILRDELATICLNQLAVFNSPVWFNAGIQEYDKTAGGVSAYKWDKETDEIVNCKKTEDRPQCSACFIQSIEDNMESILAVQVAEANLFKAGSGTGTNRSPLRSSRELLTGGGKASGPLSFMKGYDAYAGIIKSGGKTRRAAKMEILNIDHPDIVEFIEVKQKEEKKAWALIEQGYGGGMNGEAYGTVCFQNSNLSVRASDDFMKAVVEGKEWKTKYVKTGEDCETYDARELIDKISESTHICGDPGMQFDTQINKWHTCKNSGRINASNPCSEYMFIDDSACNLASINLMKFLTDDGKFDADKFKNVVKTFVIAMDLIIDGASYPADKITRNSHDFRALGLGYANLGALLMGLGLPYDSDAGRAVAAAITSILCGEAYKTSANIAGHLGPFKYFEKNREEYYKKLREVSTKNEWVPWIKFFLKGVAIQSEIATKVSENVMDLQKKYALLLKGNKDCNMKTQTIMEFLFFNPYITIPTAKKIINASFPTAKNHIEILEELGIIKKVNIVDSKSQFYLAEELLDTIMQRV